MMRNTMRLRRGVLGLCLLIGTGLVGCGGGESDTPAPTPSGTRGLTFTIETPKLAYKRGEKMPVTLMVTNTSDKPVSVYSNVGYGTRADLYNAAGRGLGLIYTDITDQRVVTYQPGETRRLPHDLSLPPGEPVSDFPTGRYKLAAWIHGSLIGYDDRSAFGIPTELAAEPVNIEIVE